MSAPRTAQGLLGWAEAELKSAGIDNAALDARLIFAAGLEIDADTLRFGPDREINSAAEQRLRRLIERRARFREPVSRILGQREFWSLCFSISTHVLDPRPDSETLVEASLALFPDRLAPIQVLDLGTGCGCLLIAVLHELPNAFGVGVDRSFRAAEEASLNVYGLNVSDRAEIVVGDWAHAIDARFDLVLCNPPYVAETERASLAPEVARHDPPAALFAGPDGLAAYRALLPDVPRLLAPGGYALFEIGATQAAAVSEIARGAGLLVDSVKRDLAGHDRCVVLKTP